MNLPERLHILSPSPCHLLQSQWMRFWYVYRYWDVNSFTNSSWQFWNTGELKGATSQADEAFAYDELELQSTTDSIAQQHVSLSPSGCIQVGHDLTTHQQITFDKAVGPKCSELEDKYPVDNDPLFPGKHIYTDNKMGFQFELNTGRIMVWASHLVKIYFCFYFGIMHIHPGSIVPNTSRPEMFPLVVSLQDLVDHMVQRVRITYNCWCM